MRLFVFLFVLLQTLSGCGQQPEWLFLPRRDTSFFPLGADSLQIIRYQYDTARLPFFVHLHHNEQTADSALHHYLMRNGGAAIGLHNNQERLVQIFSGGVRYLFDPNRMFTPLGIEQSLKWYGPFDKAVADSILLFAQQVSALLPGAVPIIAMHNNTDGQYSLLSYKQGGAFEKEAKAVFRNPIMDVDDFVLTTDENMYQALKAAAINVVLQDNEMAADDGSLGYIMGKTGRVYINIEAQHGHFAKQLRILEVVIKYLQQQVPY